MPGCHKASRQPCLWLSTLPPVQLQVLTVSSVRLVDRTHTWTSCCCQVQSFLQYWKREMGLVSAWKRTLLATPDCAEWSEVWSWFEPRWLATWSVLLACGAPWDNPWFWSRLSGRLVLVYLQVLIWKWWKYNQRKRATHWEQVGVQGSSWLIDRKMERQMKNPPYRHPDLSNRNQLEGRPRRLRCQIICSSQVVCNCATVYTKCLSMNWSQLLWSPVLAGFSPLIKKYWNQLQTCYRVPMEPVLLNSMQNLWEYQHSICLVMTFWLAVNLRLKRCDFGESLNYKVPTFCEF